MIVHLTVLRVLSACGWTEGWSQAKRSQRDAKAALIQPRSPKWQQKTFILTLVNKTTSLLFRLHLAQKAMFDESTAVILGDQHK